MATIVDRNFDYFAQDDFRVRNPDIKIVIDGKPISKQEFSVTVTLENPLPIPLKNGKFYIQSSGLDKQLKIELNEVIIFVQYSVLKTHMKLYQYPYIVCYSKYIQRFEKLLELPMYI